MSRVWTFAAFWAVGDLFVDADGDGLADELPEAGENRFVHFMVTERVRDPRDEFYKITLVGDDNIRDGIHAHLVLPPIQVEITRDAFGEPTKFTFLGPPNNPRPLAALNAPAPVGIGKTVVPVPLPEEDQPQGRMDLLAGPAPQIFFHIMWEDITTLAPKARPTQRPSPARGP